MLKKLVGNKSFYKMLFVVALPIMIQQGISSFVNLLDNLMVGRVGTEEMSGVAIVNQLLFVYNLCIFGCLAGPSIFSAQFNGAKDIDGIKVCFRYKIIVSALIFIIGFTVLMIFQDPLIRLFLHNVGEEVGDIELAFRLSKEYLKVIFIGLLPFAVTQIYSTTLREAKDTFVPMLSSIIAILTNLVLNYILIFGHLGFEPLGVRGAAIATVISRFVEMGILLIYTHTHTDKYPFMKGIYRNWKMSSSLTLKITGKGLPLFFNELLWSTGMTVLFKIYSERGFYVVPAFNISSTAHNLFIISFLAFGNAISIIIGQLLGSGKLEEARDTSRKILFFIVIFSALAGLLFVGFSTFIPDFYNTSASVKDLARSFMIISGLCFPIYGFNTGCYFNLRAGGIAFITFLFDSLFVLVVNIPLALMLVRLTPLNIVWVYLFVQLSEILKSLIGFGLVRKGVWVRNLVYSS